MPGFGPVDFSEFVYLLLLGVNSNGMSTYSLLQNKNQRLIEVLNDCVEACNSCSTQSLREKDVGMLTRCIQLDRDCADICSLTSEYFSRESEFAAALAKQCAVICDTCAQECEKHSHMIHCKECAEICRRCANECRKV